MRWASNPTKKHKLTVGKGPASWQGGRNPPLTTNGQFAQIACNGIDMEIENQNQPVYKRILGVADHPLFNLGTLIWGLFLAIVWATRNNDVYLLAKAGEVVALALGKMLIQRQLSWFFRGLLLTGIAIPVALYTTTPIFWHRYLSPGSEEFIQIVFLGVLCSLPLVFVALWGMRKKAVQSAPDRSDPGWVKVLNLTFKLALAVMLLSFHHANPPLIILGILVFLGGMIALSVVRLRLTLRHVGNFLVIVGGAVAIIAVLLVPLGIAHVSPGEAALAVVPGVILAALGFFIRLGSE